MDAIAAAIGYVATIVCLTYLVVVTRDISFSIALLGCIGVVFLLMIVFTIDALRGVPK